jgi:pyruvate/2-oxoglutarate dehydrogenase complex dihydrolipoamide dehydrogenase (E3) component
MSKRIIIIGGGPAGIEAARAAAKAKAEVTLVSEGPIGGRSGWHSLLPSKVWLSAADAAGLMAKSPFTGKQETPAPNTILPHLQRVKEQWNAQQAANLKVLGVNIVVGVASFEAADSIVVKDTESKYVTTLTGEEIILAPGSVPFFPPNLKPDGKKIIAPRFMSGLKTLPASVAVIGAGATGTEVVYLFNRLGVDVTWIVDKFGVLPAFSPAAGELLADILIKRNVNLVRVDLADHFEYEEDEVAVVMSDGTREKAAMVFVAIGRFPDLKRLNLEAVGLAIAERKALETNLFCQTSVSSIYAVGDATGPPMLANRAMAMARVAGLHAAGADVAPFNPNSVIAAIYCEPQIAQVGVLASDDDAIQTTRVSFGAVMKAHLLSEMEGFVELAFNRTGKVTGGVAVGPHASDVLAPVALAVKTEATLNDMASIFAAQPTLSELAFAAARQT